MKKLIELNSPRTAFRLIDGDTSYTYQLDSDDKFLLTAKTITIASKQVTFHAIPRN